MATMHSDGNEQRSGIAGGNAQAGKAGRGQTAARKPSAAARGEGAKPRFKPKIMDELHRKLLEERHKYLHSAEEYQAEAQSLLEARDIVDVKFDEEGGEGDTTAVERERDIALSKQARAIVAQIDAALDRIRVGTYGYCVTSGEPIPLARLRAIPWAAERVEVKVSGFRRS